jgi:hemoglobin
MKNVFLACYATWLIVGCATTEGAAPAGKASLYQRLGGKAAITAVTDDFLGRVAKDERINAYFANSDLPRLRAMLIDQICEASGGPCKYTGKDMLTVHAGMGVTHEAFQALVEDLVASLDAFRVPEAEKKELLGLLGPMRGDIVAPAEATAAAAAAARPAAPGGDPVAERARVLRQAAGLIEKAGVALAGGHRSLADQLFNAAELAAGPDALAELAPLFREGAPPRITTPLRSLPRNTPAQPATAGSSDEEDPAPEIAAEGERRAPEEEARARRGSLAGTLTAAGGGAPDGLAVVTLEPLAPGRAARRRQPKQRVIEQRNREFAPKVLAVPVGSTVAFPNFDDIYHNVFSRSQARPFDLGIYKAGQARELLFDREGVVRVGCNLHANMSAYVVVVSAPHYVISDARGRFSFRSLEPGRYRLRAWREGSETPAVQEIEVKPDRNSVTVAFTGGSGGGGAGGRAVLADKFGVPRAGARVR